MPFQIGPNGFAIGPNGFVLAPDGTACCCAVECSVCSAGTAPAQFRVTWSNTVNCTCTDPTPVQDTRLKSGHSMGGAYDVTRNPSVTSVCRWYREWTSNFPFEWEPCNPNEAAMNKLMLFLDIRHMLAVGYPELVVWFNAEFGGQIFHNGVGQVIPLTSPVDCAGPFQLIISRVCNNNADSVLSDATIDVVGL